MPKEAIGCDGRNEIFGALCDHRGQSEPRLSRSGPDVYYWVFFFPNEGRIVTRAPDLHVRCACQQPKILQIHLQSICRPFS